MAPAPANPAPSPARGSWCVWRQDDNGNRFLLRRHLPEAEARRLVSHYDSLGHKQLYWAEREETTP
jgi:hypothetical protein